MRRTIGRLGCAAVAAAAVMGLAACGGGDSTSTTSGGDPPQQAPFTDDRDGLATPTPASDAAHRQPRGPSVNYNDPPPPIAAAVTAAATTDAAALLKQLTEKFGGKGGGRPDLAQGGGLQGAPDDFISTARDALL